MDKNGYAPLYGEYNADKTKIEEKKSEELELDPTKLHYIEKLVSLCRERNIQLAFSISPSFELNDVESYSPLIDICKKYGVVLMNFDNAKPLNEQNILWKESVHLNHNGAKEFTSNYVIPELKKHYKHN